MLSQLEIQAIIQRGENSAVEFKAEGVRAENLARELVAFANTQGGTIFLGVDDRGKLSGLTQLDELEPWIMNLARNNVRPALQVEY